MSRMHDYLPGELAGRTLQIEREESKHVIEKFRQIAVRHVHGDTDGEWRHRETHIGSDAVADTRSRTFPNMALLLPARTRPMIGG